MPFRHARLDQIIVAYANSKTKTMLLVIMLNRSRFVYSVLHSLLSLFAFSLDHLTTTYAVSSRTARPNRPSLYHLTVFVFLVVTATHRGAFVKHGLGSTDKTPFEKFHLKFCKYYLVRQISDENFN